MIRTRSPWAAAFAAGVAALTVSFASPAWAGEGAKAPTAPPHVDYTALPLPVIVGGRLVNYVFVVLRLTPRSVDDLTRVKEREPYVRDRLLRVAHAEPFVTPGDLTHVDERRITALVTREADQLIGPRLLARVEVASETPQRRSGLPLPPSARPIIP